MAHRTVPNTIELDAVSWKILEALQLNARKSFAEIGRQIGLSTPAVAERVHRLEEAGVITGYHVALDVAKLGVPIRVMVRHRVTGDESFVIEANVVSIRHMEALIDRLSALGATSTSTVLSSPVQRRQFYSRQIEAFDKYI